MSDEGRSDLQIIDRNPVVRQSVVAGTQDQPLVVENVRQNGAVDKVRIVNPERYYQIPTFVFWDRTVTPEQQEIIKQACADLFTSAGLNPRQLSYYGDWHEQDYRDPQGKLIPHRSIEWQLYSKWNASRSQIDVDSVVYEMCSDPYQKTAPHQEVIFTNQDLYSSGTDFVIGVAMPDLGTIISLGRLSTVTDLNLRRECIRTEIFHEFGHMLGLPSTRRGAKRLESSLGLHCRSEGCSMRQGLMVPNDWINFTRERIMKGGRPYCGDCTTDFDTKFRKNR